MSENTRIECPKCGWSKEVPPEAIGRMADCPSCGARFRLEAADGLEDALVEVPPEEPSVPGDPLEADAPQNEPEPDAPGVAPAVAASDDGRLTNPPSGWLGGLALLWRILGVVGTVGSLIAATAQITQAIALAAQLPDGNGSIDPSRFAFYMGFSWLAAATLNFAVCFTVAEALDAAKTIILRLGRR